MRNFANKEAVTFLGAALARADEAHLEIAKARRAGWELLLGEAYVNLTDYVSGRQHIEAGLALLGLAVPVNKLSQFGGILWQVLQQALHRISPGYYLGRRASQKQSLLAASRACERLDERAASAKRADGRHLTSESSVLEAIRDGPCLSPP